MMNKKKRYMALLICLVFISAALSNIWVAAQVNAREALPENEFGANYTVFDTVAEPTGEKGIYNVQTTARISVNAAAVSKIQGGSVECSWPEEWGKPILSETPPLGAIEAGVTAPPSGAIYQRNI